EARVGEGIENVGEVIDNVLIKSLAESREEIAKALAFGESIGIDPTQLEAAAAAAFDFAAIFDQDVNATLRAANKLVQTGLADSFGEAFDLMTSGMQSSIVASDDLLDVINEFAS